MQKEKLPDKSLRRTLRFFGYSYFFLVFVAVLYLWLITKDRYVAESMVKITTEAGNFDMSGLSTGSSSVQAAASLTGAQMTNGYIASADLLLQLEREFDLQTHYTSPAYDFVFRMKRNASIEERIEFYRARISSRYDIIEGVTVISVDTFDRDLSLRVNKRILNLTEELINGINRKIANQQVAYYVDELKRAEENLDSINAKMLAMQDEKKLISPESAISTSLRVIDEMYAKTLAIENEIATLERDSPGSPRIDILRSQLRTLNETIERERNKLSGDDQKRMNLFMMQYKDLQQRLEFASEIRNHAEITLEKNRAMRNMQTHFYVVVQQPFRPEKHSIPQRPYWTITILVIGTLAFFVMRTLALTIFESA